MKGTGVKTLNPPILSKSARKFLPLKIFQIGECIQITTELTTQIHSGPHQRLLKQAYL